MADCVDAVSAEAPGAVIADRGEPYRIVISRALALFAKIAERRVLACVLVLLLTLGLRAALLPWEHIPGPVFQDEFGYLLAADTYAHGRMTNPTPPFWEHFESFHIILKPTYTSKYQPLQGLVLAFGEKVFGEPWVGVWISAGLMCAFTCWMLQGWTSPSLALLGSLLLMLRIGVFSYWMNSYWGGAVPAIGGALILGALPRIGLRKQFAHAVTLAIGIVVLINSRPYDGAVLTVLAAGCLAWWLFRRVRSPFWSTFARVVLPIAAILAVAGLFMAYFNYRVTGNPFELPYQEHERQYAAAPALAWGSIHPEKVYRHEVMRRYWKEWGIPVVTMFRQQPITSSLVRIGNIYAFYFGMWGLLAPPLLWLRPLKTTEERLTLVLLAVFLLALVPVTGFNPHYSAAGVSLMYLLFLQGLMRLSRWNYNGRAAGRVIAVFSVFLFFCPFAKPDWGTKDTARRVKKERQDVIQTLNSQPGGHIVLVRYASDHFVHYEWVYNLADIPAQRIIWAHEMGAREDQPMLDYFKDRQAWILEPDQSPPRLRPYSDALPDRQPQTN